MWQVHLIRKTDGRLVSNDDYGRKREILLKSHLELNKYFEAVTEWNDPLIRARAEFSLTGR